MSAQRTAFGAFLAIVIAIHAPTARSAEADRAVLAPTSKLRVGVYLGSPTSMVQEPKTGEMHGLSVDIGKELAKRLDVPAELVRFERIADVLDAIKTGQVDFTISNATPARAQDVLFSPTLLSIELGYLVPSASPITAINDVDKSGVKVGVTKGSTSERTLPKLLPNATLVPVQNVVVAIEMLRRGEIDTYATNKAILFEMSDSLPGAKVLDGRWGVEHLAVAIPRGREQGLDYVRRFIADVQSSGLLTDCVQRSGLRGSAKAE